MNYMRFPEFKAKALTLSYDDGVSSDIKFLDIINKYGMKCTFNLNGSHFEAEERENTAGKSYYSMARREALEIYNGERGQGHEIAIHGYTHPHLEVLPPEMTAYEIVEDRKKLENTFGKIVKGMAYPFGTYNNSVVEVLRSCGILYSRTTVSTRSFHIPTDWLRMPATCHHNDPNLMNLADQFLEDILPYRFPKLFYLWGHTYEFVNNNNWDVIEKFGEKVGNRDDVWYATNMEIYTYVEAYRALQFSSDGSMVYNPTATKVYFLADEGKQIEVGAGEAIKIK